MKRDNSMGWLLLGGGGLLLLGGVAAHFKRKALAPMADSTFTLVKNAYASLTAWAADRGRQIRSAFGITPDPLRPYTPSGPKMSDMPVDEWNRRKIASLSPAAQAQFTAFMADAQSVARKHGAELAIWWAVRPLETQLEKYKEGRTLPGKKVTDTIASNHLWGLAVDLVFRSPTGQPWFDGPAADAKGYPHWYYAEVLPLAAKHGLQSLYLKYRKDAPHVELVAGVGQKVASASRALKADFPGLA